MRADLREKLAVVWVKQEKQRNPRNWRNSGDFAGNNARN